jgi:hypothetical protein
MKTLRQIATAALEELGVIAASETVAAEDMDLARRRYGAVLADLRDAGLAYWTNTNLDTEEIPDAVEIAMTQLLASRLAAVFGKPDPKETGEDGQETTFAVSGMRRLRRHMAKRPSGETTPFSSF